MSVQEEERGEARRLGKAQAAVGEFARRRDRMLSSGVSVQLSVRAGICRGSDSMALVSLEAWK